MCSHGADGDVQGGSIAALAEAFSEGCAVKVGISDLCDDLCEGAGLPSHEVFVEAGSCYYYVEQKLFIAGTHPVVRVKPGIPMNYKSRGWDFGWLVVKTNGGVACRICDPYTLGFTDSSKDLAIRWFVR